MRYFFQLPRIDCQRNFESGRGQCVISAAIVAPMEATIRGVFGPARNRRRLWIFGSQTGTEKNDNRYQGCRAHTRSIEGSSTDGIAESSETTAGRGLWGESRLNPILLIVRPSNPADELGCHTGCISPGPPTLA